MNDFVVNGCAYASQGSRDDRERMAMRHADSINCARRFDRARRVETSRPRRCPHTMRAPRRRSLRYGRILVHVPGRRFQRDRHQPASNLGSNASTIPCATSLIGRSPSIIDKQSLRAIVVKDRLGLFVVDVEPSFHRFGSIVAPLDELGPTDIAHSRQLSEG